MDPGGSSSLLDFPLPLADLSSDFCCEYDATLRYDGAGGPPGAAPLWTALRALTLPLETDSTTAWSSNSLMNEPLGLLSAKNAFLPPQKERQFQMKRALSTWLDEGFFSALESLASTSEGRFTTFWARGLESVAMALLAAYRMTSNIHSSFNPHLMLSGEDMIARFSPNPDWFSSKIRVMAWHPHTLKLAVALKSDQIQVLGQNLVATPTLKYKKQRGIACLAWRPLNGSELAVGCLTGLLIWTVDPLSVAARPSASCVNVLPTPPGHAPVTSLNWDPQGNLLLSASAADTSMILWNTASETKVPLRRVGGGGVHLVAWSPEASKVLAATPSTVFRVWDTINQWNHERWNVLAGHVNTACWSPCGTYLLFSTNEEPLIYCLNFHPVGGSSAAAVPIADMSQIQVDLDGQIMTIGGSIQSMKWNSMGERLAVSFKNSDLIALYCTTLYPSLVLSPIGLIQGLEGESPMVLEFAHQCDHGAILSVAWSSGRIQHIPLFYVPLIERNPAPLIINPDFEIHNSFHAQPTPELFSTPLTRS